MAEKKENIINSNPLLFRYAPNNRFTKGAFKNQVEVKLEKEDYGESITDKESYRLSLASKRGAIGSGSAQSGWYMFADGKYDHNKDFSYLMRQDLSIVDIDRYIEQLKVKLENSDESLKAEIKEQLEAAQNYKQNKKEEPNDSNINNSEE